MSTPPTENRLGQGAERPAAAGRLGLGSGGLPARAWSSSDAPSLDLSGDWRFRLSPRADAGLEFADPGYDDSGWARMPVPSH
ncbi:MAG TPA: hypothetical protein VG637_02055, partial [Actinomycetes bacterium]|nr:hypothetical protein [Actinomycetes bacterium]